MVAILPLLLLSGAFAGKQEIDAIGQRDQERRFMDAQIGEMKTQAAMAAWELEKARADDLANQKSQDALGSFYKSQIQGDIAGQRAAPGMGASLQVQTPFGPVQGRNVDTQPRKATRLNALEGVWDKLTPGAQALALDYAEREDASEAIGEAAAGIQNSIDLAVQKGSLDGEMVAPISELLGMLTGDPKQDAQTVGRAGEALQEVYTSMAKSQAALVANEEVITKLGGLRQMAGTDVQRGAMDLLIAEVTANPSYKPEQAMDDAWGIMAPERRGSTLSLEERAFEAAQVELKAWIGSGLREKKPDEIDTYMKQAYARQLSLLNGFLGPSSAGGAPAAATPRLSPIDPAEVLKALKASEFSEDEIVERLAFLVKAGRLTEEQAVAIADDL